jgi:hypothetical protein
LTIRLLGETGFVFCLFDILVCFVLHYSNFRLRLEGILDFVQGTGVPNKQGISESYSYNATPF